MLFFRERRRGRGETSGDRELNSDVSMAREEALARRADIEE
jgi:hypothetical protein